MRTPSLLGPCLVLLAPVLALACNRAGPDLAPEAARAAVDPGVPTGELGRDGDRLHEASPAGSWIAVCRGEQGLLILDEAHAITFHHFVDHDDTGRWVIVTDEPPAERRRLVDTWTRTTVVLAGFSPSFSRDGRRLAQNLDDGVEIRELTSGETRRIPRGDLGVGRLDESGRFLYFTKVTVEDPSPRDDSPEPGTCMPVRRGGEEGRMGRVARSLVAIDEPGTPSYRLPTGVSLARVTFGGWPLLEVYQPPQIQRWTPSGVETLIEGDASLFPADVRTNDFVYGTTTPEGKSLLIRYADGRGEPIAPYGSDDNRAAPDSLLYGFDYGVIAATEGRYVHLDTGAIVQATAETPNAYAHGDRVLLLGDGKATLVAAKTGEVLHRYDTGARPSLAAGGWVALRTHDGSGAVLLDLDRPGFIARVSGPTVALTDDGHALVAAGPAAARVTETVGPFRWHKAEETALK